MLGPETSGNPPDYYKELAAKWMDYVTSNAHAKAEMKNFADFIQKMKNSE